MSHLWWLEPGWTKARCGCGATIWPEGDPDWGVCYGCMCAQQEQQQSDREQEHYAALEHAYWQELWDRENR